uniref:Uncharacterized protein n=1 Tax=Octopus bimaculoides TaxID=37653 RepID=A0A0L8HRH1_OCTBM
MSEFKLGSSLLFIPLWRWWWWGFAVEEIKIISQVLGSVPSICLLSFKMSALNPAPHWRPMWAIVTGLAPKFETVIIMINITVIML